ncbi:MAG TPA: phosphoribosyltransferase family protein [Gaiellaceae bacterium]|nr:phosphoribosyltransferase family protein [Gaiellaceae bacterium]
MAELLAEAPLFADRRDAGRLLARRLESERGTDAVVVGLARGGVVTAAEVASALRLPLDVVAVRKVGHPWQPEYAIGAVTPGDGVYVRGPDGLTDEQVQAAVGGAKSRAEELDRRLHQDSGPVELAGKTCVLVDDGLATGATMIAAVRWARSRGAARVVAAVPVAALASLPLVEAEADAAVCLHELDPFVAVGFWYGTFDQVEDGEVKRLLAVSALAAAAARPS